MTIVLGTTLRPEARAYGDVAGSLALRLGVRVRLVHVCEEPRAAAVLGTDEEHVLGGVRAALEAEARRITEATGATVSAHLAAGPVVPALASIGQLELAFAALVAPSMRTHPLGGIAGRLARTSTVPVVSLREPAPLAAWLRGERPLRILVGADGGRASQAARAFAARLEGAGPCVVQVVHVASPRATHARLGLPPPPADHALGAEAEQVLLRDLERSAPATERAATLRVLAGRGGAAPHLVAHADQEDFDLVVVGQRKGSLVEELWYGSVSHAVLVSAPISVVCVPPAVADPPADPRRPEVVVAGVDLTDESERVLAHALAHAGPGARVHVAHVLTGSHAEATTRDRAWHELGALGRAVAPEPERHVLEGHAAEQLLALCERLGADLLVVGASARSGMQRALLGSVAQALSSKANLPLLLVPPRRA